MFSKVITVLCIATVTLQQTTAASRRHHGYDYDSYEDNDDCEDYDSSEEYDSSEHSSRYSSRDASNWNEATIRDEYDVDKLPRLALAINNIYKDTDDLKTYKKMVKLQIYLFNLFQDKYSVNDEYVFDVAYYFSKIKENALYTQLSSGTKTSFDKYLDILPTSANVLFFDKSFCLMNREYDNKFLYSSNENIDSKRNYVFLSTKDNFNQKGKSEWQTKVTDASTKYSTKLKFTLQSVKSAHYAYVERNRFNDKRNLVATWNASSKPTNTDWNIKLFQNQLIFSQNGRVICASESLKSDSRRYVYGEDENGEAVAACQWFARECPQ